MIAAKIKVNSEYSKDSIVGLPMKVFGFMIIFSMPNQSYCENISQNQNFNIII